MATSNKTYTETKNDLFKQITTVKKLDENDLPYEKFINVPDFLLIDGEKDIGSRVWIASMPRTTKCSLHKVDENAFFVKFQGEVPIRAFYKDEVIIHPDHWTKKRINYKIKVKSKFE